MKRGTVVSVKREDDIKFRRYEHKRDAEAALAIFKEVSWVEQGKDREKDEVTRAFFKAGRSWIAELRGRAESLCCNRRCYQHHSPQAAVRLQDYGRGDRRCRRGGYPDRRPGSIRTRILQPIGIWQRPVRALD